MPLKRLIDNVEEQIGRERRVDPLRGRLAVSLDTTETGRIRPERCVQVEHELCLRLSVRFWANTAEKYEAHRNAESAIKDFLYRDVVGQLAQIRAMLDHSDRHSLQLAITELMGSLRP